jgi:hypothetical protein
VFRFALSEMYLKRNITFTSCPTIGKICDNILIATIQSNNTKKTQIKKGKTKEGRKEGNVKQYVFFSNDVKRSTSICAKWKAVKTEIYSRQFRFRYKQVLSYTCTKCPRT